MLANCTLFSLKLISFSCYDHSQFNCITEMLFSMCYMPVFDLDRPVGYFIWPVTKSKQKQNKVDWKMFVVVYLVVGQVLRNGIAEFVELVVVELHL